MSRITRSNARPIQKSKITIRGYEFLNFSNAMTNETFLRPDMYKIINDDEELDKNYFREETCDVPILFLSSKAQLGIQCKEINYKNFQVIEDNCSKNYKCSVIIDNKPGTTEMTLSEVLENMKVEYSKRKHIYNFLSLNYTFTELENVFKCPTFVTELDLAISNWPDVLKIAQIKCDCDNGIFIEKLIPMTWNYCTISAKGSYTDFHIDFGGSNVWISVIFGKKTFWIIPPTDYNIAAFELYLKDSYSKKKFFGFCAADCCKITLIGGQSFFLPAGWIHAVYTEEDTLMIGGNFITSAALETHIKILKSEQRQRAEAAYTYLYFKELMWYTVAATVYDVTGLNYIDYKQFKNIEYVNMCQCESFYQKNEKILSFVKRYLKNENIKNELINGSYFKKNTTNQIAYETIVQRNKINKWTVKEAKGYKSLLEYIKKYNKLMEKNVPIGITNCNKMIQDFERIINFASDDIFKLNIKETNLSIISWNRNLREKADKERKRKIQERKEKNEKF
uniref:JmjC domain-containing protein n=1 Tax=Strongyloides venezuelensis TaxID=75913 RepID=A0A0K0G382_STRVS